jgi:nucleoside phosphorylase
MKYKELTIAEVKGKIDFGIITIREDEFQSVLDRLPTESFIKGRNTYALSRLKTMNDDEYVIASVRCPEQGNAQGQTVAHNLIEDLNPQWVLLVGIAACVPDVDYTLGDVLLAMRLHDFSVSASLEDQAQKTSQQFAAKGGPMHPAVQNLLAALPAIAPFLEKWNTKELISRGRPKVTFAGSNFYGDSKWKRRVKESLERYFGKNAVRKVPKAFSGSIASSDALVKDTQLAKQWLAIARQINGIEMELAGVYQAAWSAQIPVLAIRGISDIVGFRRSPDWIGYACNTAAAFLIAILRYRPIIPQALKHLESPNAARSEPVTAELHANHPVSAFIAQPPKVSPTAKAETLYSNLVKVSYTPEYLYAVQTPCTKTGEVWNLLKRDSDDPPGDWVLKDGTIYSFHDFSDPIWENVCDIDTVEPHPTSHWSESRDQNRQSEFVELLRNCVKEWGKLVGLKYIYKLWVNKAKRKFKYLCYAPTPDLSDKFVGAKSLVQVRDKKVFGAHYAKATSKFLYYRHHALRFEFVRFDDQWYMELAPTFHYTWNGYSVSNYYEDLVKGLKRMQKNNAVFLLVVFWARVLQNQTSDSKNQADYPFLKFGELLRFPFPYGIYDDLWMNKEPIEKAEKSGPGKRVRRPARGRGRGRRRRA